MLKPRYKSSRVSDLEGQRWPWAIFPAPVFEAPVALASPRRVSREQSHPARHPALPTGLAWSFSLLTMQYASPLNDAPCRSSSSKIPYGPWPLLPCQAHFFKAHIPAGDFGCPLISLWVLRLTRSIYVGGGGGGGSHPEWILS